MKIQLSNHCDVILIESSLLPMLDLFYPHLFPYYEAVSQGTLITLGTDKSIYWL